MTDPRISELTAMALKFRNDRDWKQFHNFKDMFLSMSLEVAELVELAQWKNGDALDTYLRANADRVGEELSDVLWWILTIAADLQLDLGDAFEKKMIVNDKKYPIDKAKGSSRKYTEL